MQGLRRDFTLQITHLPIVFTTANVYSISSSFFASVSANRSFRNVANSFHILVNYWNCVFWNYSRAILHIKSLSLCLSQSWSRSFHLDYNEVNFFVKKQLHNAIKSSLLFPKTEKLSNKSFEDFPIWGESERKKQCE